MNCLQHQNYAGSIGLMGGVVAATLLLLCALPGKSEPGATNTPASPASSVTSSNVAVELSSNQLDAIKIGPVGTYPFAMEKEAVGTISFDEDPAIVQAESTLLGAAGTAQVASNELVRAQALYETNGVAQRELEQATSDEETAEAALKAVWAALRALGKTNDEINQMISSRALAAPGQDSAKWLLLNVAESDSPFVQPGQTVKVRLTAFPDRTFGGKVSRVYAALDPNLHHLPVRCEIEDPGNELRPEMLATASIVVTEPSEAPALPVNAVVREGDGTMTAWVTTDRQHFTQRIIKTGLRQDGVVQVLDGLQGANLVVTDGAIFLDNMVNAVPGD